MLLLFGVLTPACAASPKSAVVAHVAKARTPVAGAAPEAAGETNAARAALHAAIEKRIEAGPSSLMGPEALDDARNGNALAPIPPLQRERRPRLSKRPRTDHFRLPPNAIRRVVRHQSGKFRRCYQEGVRRNRALAGRVVVQFAIGADGQVWRARESMATLPDREVRRCVLQAFFELTFPNPNRQTIYVEYPLQLSRETTRKLDVLADAARAAQAPPPGFAEAYLAGTPVTRPSTEPPTPTTPPEPPPSACDPGDPLCAD